MRARMASNEPPNVPRYRALALRLGILAAAVVLGLLLQRGLSERLAGIVARADEDVVGARRDLAVLMRIVMLPLLVLTTALGAAIASSARRALLESRFPPAGGRLWHRAGPVRTGEAARRRAGFALGLGIALVLASLAALGLVGWITHVLLLCRA